MDTKQVFEDLIAAELDELGATIDVERAELAQAMTESADRLAAAAATNDPGFDRMLKLERNTIAMSAGLAASDAARATDARLVGMIGTALRIAAIAIA